MCACAKWFSGANVVAHRFIESRQMYQIRTLWREITFSEYCINHKVIDCYYNIVLVSKSMNQEIEFNFVIEYGNTIVSMHKKSNT